MTRQKKKKKTLKLFLLSWKEHSWKILVQGPDITVCQPKFHGNR